MLLLGNQRQDQQQSDKQPTIQITSTPNSLTTTRTDLDNSIATTPTLNHSDDIAYQSDNANSQIIEKLDKRLSSTESRLQEFEKSLLAISLYTLQSHTLHSRLPHSTPSVSSVSSVVTSLRWAFLRTLEKPLKQLNLHALGQYGLANTVIEVKAT